MSDLIIFLALAILAIAHRLSVNKELETKCSLLEEALQRAMVKYEETLGKYEKLYETQQRESMCVPPPVIDMTVNVPKANFPDQEIEKVMGLMGIQAGQGLVKGKGRGVSLTATIMDENRLDKVIEIMEEDDDGD